MRTADLDYEGRTMVPEPQSPSLRGVYGISTISELSSVGPQTLKLHDRRGLLTPRRTHTATAKRTLTLRRITTLLADGVNLVGIGLILSLEVENASLARRIAQLSKSADSQL